jgi:hypothetical protein
LDLFRVGFVTKGNSEMVKYALQKDILEISDFKKIKALLSEPPEKLIGIAKNFATKDDESIMEMF